MVFRSGRYATVGGITKANRIVRVEKAAVLAVFFHTHKDRRKRIMKSIWNTIQLVFSGIGGYVGYFMGGRDGFLYALLIFVIADYITGVLVAIFEKRLSSEVGFKGICRKVLIFMLVGIANVLDVSVIGTGSVLRTAVIFFYISNEGVSLLENTAKLSGFSLKLSSDGEFDEAEISMPVKIMSYFPVYAVSEFKMHTAYVRVFFS